MPIGSLPPDLPDSLPSSPWTRLVADERPNPGAPQHKNEEHDHGPPQPDQASAHRQQSPRVLQAIGGHVGGAGRFGATAAFHLAGRRSQQHGLPAWRGQRRSAERPRHPLDARHAGSRWRDRGGLCRGDRCCADERRRQTEPDDRCRQGDGPGRGHAGRGRDGRCGRRSSERGHPRARRHPDVGRDLAPGRGGATGRPTVRRIIRPARTDGNGGGPGIGRCSSGGVRDLHRPVLRTRPPPHLHRRSRSCW